MATVTSYTAERMKRIEDETVVDGDIVGDDLVLVTRSGTQIHAGNVRGIQGVPGPPAPASDLPYQGGPGLSASTVEDALDELATEKADKTELTALVPPGCIMPWAGIALAPAGWLLCDGAAIPRANYVELYNAIATSYGAGDGSSTFNLPNLAGKVPVGFSQPDLEFNLLGKSGGEKAHILTIPELASHGHGVNDPTHRHGVGGDTGLRIAISTFSSTLGLGTGGSATTYSSLDAAATGIGIQPSGGNNGHNNLQPYLTVRYIIKF